MFTRGVRLSIFLLIFVSVALTSDLNEVADLIKHLLINYDRSEIPEKPTNVTISLYLNNIYSIHETEMDYSANFYIEQQWHDPRLVYEHLSTIQVVNVDDEQFRNKIWIPDISFQNDKDTTMTPHQLLWIYPNGTVFYEIEYHAQFWCPMDLRAYPIDRQVCPIVFESFSASLHDVRFQWLTGNKAVSYEDSDKFNLVDYTWQGYTTFDCSSQYKRGQFACIGVRLYLTRNIAYYMIQLYVPTILIVILSWSAFWISDDAVPARVTIALMTVLNMTTIAFGARSSLPRVGYVTALDIWIFACLVAVVGGLIEFAMVNVHGRNKINRNAQIELLTKILNETRANNQNKNQNQNQNQNQDTATTSTVVSTPDSPIPNSHMASTSFVLKDRRLGSRNSIVSSNGEVPKLSKIKAKPVKKLSRIDIGSRVLFPLTFVIFNIAYWTVYLVLISEVRRRDKPVIQV